MCFILYTQFVNGVDEFCTICTLSGWAICHVFQYAFNGFSLPDFFVVVYDIKQGNYDN